MVTLTVNGDTLLNGPLTVNGPVHCARLTGSCFQASEVRKALARLSERLDEVEADNRRLREEKGRLEAAVEQMWLAPGMPGAPTCWSESAEAEPGPRPPGLRRA